MGIIRMIIVLLAVIIFLIVGIFVMLYEDLFLRGDRKKKDDLSMRFVRFGFRMVWFLSGCKAEIIGAENIPEDRAVLYIANHNSIFDIVLFGANVRSLTGIVAKVSLEKVPLLATWMRRIYCLFLDRSDVRKGLEVVLKAIGEIKEGISILIFPEGTRNHEPGQLQEFHAGSFKIATKAGAPIVPVTIIGTREIFEAHFPAIRPAKATIIYGEPIETAGMSRQDQKELPERVRSLIQDTYNAHVSKENKA